MIAKKTKQNIIKELGIEKLSSDKAEEAMEKLEKIIQRKVALEILDLLDKEDQKRIPALVGSGDNKKISEFLSKKIPAIDSLVKAVAESTVKEFKDSTK